MFFLKNLKYVGKSKKKILIIHNLEIATQNIDLFPSPLKNTEHTWHNSSRCGIMPFSLLFNMENVLYACATRHHSTTWWDSNENISFLQLQMKGGISRSKDEGTQDSPFGSGLAQCSHNTRTAQRKIPQGYGLLLLKDPVRLATGRPLPPSQPPMSPSSQLF